MSTGINVANTLKAENSRKERDADESGVTKEIEIIKRFYFKGLSFINSK